MGLAHLAPSDDVVSLIDTLVLFVFLFIYTFVPVARCLEERVQVFVHRYTVYYLMRFLCETNSTYVLNRKS